MKTPLSKDDFAKLMMDRIRQTGEKGKIVYDSKEFSLRGEGKTYAAMFLANAYQEYCAAPLADRNRVARHYVRNWFGASKEMPQDFEDAKPDLLPVVRSRSHFEINNLEVVDGLSLNWPYEILGEHFGVGIVYDLPEAMRSISQGSLDAWGVTFYEALEAAMENLLSMPAKFIGPGDGEGVYLSATGDNYDASRLVIKDAIRRFRVKGDHIAMIPNRENLIVVGSEDVEGLAGMVKLAAKAMKEPRPISGIALRLDGDDWTPWMPAEDHPSYKAFQELQLQSFGQDYAQQKTMLDKLYEKERRGRVRGELQRNQTPRWKGLQLRHMDGHDEFAASQDGYPRPWSDGQRATHGRMGKSGGNSGRPDGGRRHLSAAFSRAVVSF